MTALEQDNSMLRDEISNLKKEKLNHELEKETVAAETRRTLASLQIELETSRKQVAFLEQEADELRAACNGTGGNTNTITCRSQFICFLF